MRLAIFVSNLFQYCLFRMASTRIYLERANNDSGYKSIREVQRNPVVKDPLRGLNHNQNEHNTDPITC